MPPSLDLPEPCTGQDLADLGDRLRDWFQLLRENAKQNGSGGLPASPTTGMCPYHSDRGTEGAVPRAGRAPTGPILPCSTGEERGGQLQGGSGMDVCPAGHEWGPLPGGS